MKLSLSGVNRVSRKRTDGSVSVHYYYRPTGAKIEGKPGTAAFLLSYEKAQQGKPKGNVSIFADLIDSYQMAPDWRDLRPATKRVYTSYLGPIRDRFGAVDLSIFGERKVKNEVLRFRDEWAVHAPYGAEQMVCVMKVLLRFAEDRGLIEVSPLRGAKRIRPKSRSEMIWSHEQVVQLLSVANEPMNWAINLALLTAQREGDLIALKWANFHPSALILTQAKTNAKVAIPLGASIVNLISSRIPRLGETVLTNSLGRAWGADGSGFRSAFRATVEKAGLTDAGLRFHDLRGTAITALADVGCTAIQIAAISGHSLEHVSKILAVYVARTGAQAQAAVTALESTWIGKLQIPQQTRLISA